MVYFASLGYTPGVLLDAKDVKPSGAVVVFHGDRNERQVASLKDARAILKALGIEARFVEVSAAWNFEACYQAIHAEYRRLKRPRDIVVNASGGTEVLNSALTLFCTVVGARGRYVDRKDWTVKEVDFTLLHRWLSLTGTKRNITERLVMEGGRRGVSDLVSDLDVSPAAVSQALGALAEDGLVTVSPRGKGRGKTAALSDALWPLLGEGPTLDA